MGERLGGGFREEMAQPMSRPEKGDLLQREKEGLVEGGTK